MSVVPVEWPDECRPLSPGQMQMYTHQMQVPLDYLYNESMTQRITGLINLEILQESLDAVVARHEALRTIFCVSSTNFYTAVLPPDGISVPLVVRDRSNDDPEGASDE
eukprot:jgi/Picsp_1/4439/NSC_06661-R1_nonribosomal peptide synthetase